MVLTVNSMEHSWVLFVEVGEAGMLDETPNSLFC